ncbi:hypothetical protein GCM10029992_06020 [Glycomyces albus]
MPRRIGRQLALILLGGVAVFAFQIAADMGFNDNQTSVTTFALPAVITLVSLAAWGVTAALAPYSDPLLVGIATLVSGFGIVLIRRISYTYSENAIEPDAGLFAGLGGRQLIYYIGGVIVFGIFLAVIRDHRVLRGYAYILLFAGIAFAALPGFLPASISEAGGSKNWIRLGPISVQPSEFAKLMLLVFFAVYLIRKRDVLQVAGNKFLGLQFPRLKDLGPIVIVWAACLGLLVLERDLGTSLLLFSIFLSMLYMATRRVSWILIGLGLFIGGCVAIYPFFSHLQLRVRIWLDPFNEQFRDGDSYQLVQGLIGMNDGGLLGTGPGRGRPDFVPAAESDFILAIVGEEVGLIGLTALLVLYAVFVERAMKTAVMSRDQFGKLVAGGLAFQVAFQLFIVCGGVTGLIPMTGQTTTFLAAGGSSLLGSWIMLALLVRVSDDARKPWQVSYGLQKSEAPPSSWPSRPPSAPPRRPRRPRRPGSASPRAPSGRRPADPDDHLRARPRRSHRRTDLLAAGNADEPAPGPPTRPAPNGGPSGRRTARRPRPVPTGRKANGEPRAPPHRRGRAHPPGRAPRPGDMGAVLQPRRIRRGQQPDPLRGVRGAARSDPGRGHRDRPVPGDPRGFRLRLLPRLPRGDYFGNITGFKSMFRGASAIEEYEDDVLNGSSSLFLLDEIGSTFTGEEQIGGNVVLTLDADLQRAAYDAIAETGVIGGAVVIDPRTGRILAEASYPGWNPTDVASNDPDVANAAWLELLETDGNPGEDKTRSNFYPPGSTFKTIVASAYIENGGSADDMVPAGNGYTAPDTSHEITNSSDQCPENELTLREAFARSCNTTFARMCVEELSADDITETAAAYGFGEAWETRSTPSPPRPATSPRTPSGRRRASASRRRARPSSRTRSSPRPSPTAARSWRRNWSPRSPAPRATPSNAAARNRPGAPSPARPPSRCRTSWRPSSTAAPGRRRTSPAPPSAARPAPPSTPTPARTPCPTTAGSTAGRCPTTATNPSPCACSSTPTVRAPRRRPPRSAATSWSRS